MKFPSIPVEAAVFCRTPQLPYSTMRQRRHPAAGSNPFKSSISRFSFEIFATRRSLAAVVISRVASSSNWPLDGPW